jgi:galactosylceramide sulfotransferase/galactose-3-O-sulfotransferase 2
MLLSYDALAMPQSYDTFPNAAAQVIGFLKTHKTASSSVQNVLLRYGLLNRLDFVLPSTGNHLNDPNHFYLNLGPILRNSISAENF